MRIEQEGLPSYIQNQNNKKKINKNFGFSSQLYLEFSIKCKNGTKISALMENNFGAKKKKTNAMKVLLNCYLNGNNVTCDIIIAIKNAILRPKISGA